jgi:hypothetical protein
VEVPYPLGTEGIAMDEGACGDPEEGSCAEGCGGEDE